MYHYWLGCLSWPRLKRAAPVWRTTPPVDTMLELPPLCLETQHDPPAHPYPSLQEVEGMDRVTTWLHQEHWSTDCVYQCFCTICVHLPASLSWSPLMLVAYSLPFSNMNICPKDYMIITEGTKICHQHSCFSTVWNSWPSCVCTLKLC